MSEAESKSLVLVNETSSQIFSMIASAAKDPAVSVEKMQGLLDLQRELLKDQAIQAFNEDFNELERKLPRVPKNGIIPMAKGNIAFAKWEDMDDLIRPLLREHRFSLSFNAEPRDGGGGVIEGILLHVSGHSKKTRIPLPLDTGPGRNNLQAMGSTLSYGKRYCTEMLLNIVREGEDDDGTKGGALFITDEQVAEINKLIEETHTDKDNFLQLFEVVVTTNLTQENYAPAVNMLHAKLKKQGAKKS